MMFLNIEFCKYQFNITLYHKKTQNQSKCRKKQFFCRILHFYYFCDAKRWVWEYFPKSVSGRQTWQVVMGVTRLGFHKMRLAFLRNCNWGVPFPYLLCSESQNFYTHFFDFVNIERNSIFYKDFCKKQPYVV